MSDFATLITPADPGQWPGFDLAIDGYQLAEDDGLQTAVIDSLFTRRRANPDDTLPDPANTDRGGYWGDAWPPAPGDLRGSRLWLLRREKQTREAMNRAEEFAKEALAWMVEDGVARQVDATASNPTDGVLALDVTIYRATSAPSRYRFQTFWRKNWSKKR